MATDAPPSYGDTQEYGGYGDSSGPPPAREPAPTTATGETAAQPTGGYSEGTGTAAAGADAGASSGAEKTSEDDGVDGFFKERRKRILTLSAILVWFCLLALPRWLDTKDLTDAADNDSKSAESLLGVYNTHAAGLFFIFIGIVATLVIQFLEWREFFSRNWIVDLILGACIMLGAVLYGIAGAAYAGWNNKYADTFDEYESFGGAYFFESVFVAVVAGFFALDVARNILSISQRVRIFFLFVINMLACSLLLFFCYAVISGSDDLKDADKAIDTALVPATGCIASGWFFCLLANIVYLVTEFAEICCGWNDGAKTGIASFQDLILNVCNGLNVFGAFLVFAGYWAFADTITSEAGTAGGESDSNFNAYYVGLGFFVLFTSMFIAFDISWGEFISSRYA
jgi:hypothetical protein